MIKTKRGTKSTNAISVFVSFRQEVLNVFEKYIENNVRHLEKREAIHMLESEFGLEPEQAVTMFDTFDKDKNGIMSIWEFQQFYVCMGTQ